MPVACSAVASSGSIQSASAKVSSFARRRKPNARYASQCVSTLTRFAGFVRQENPKASELVSRMQADNTRLVTTRAVLLEIGNALAKLRYRAAAILLLGALEADPSVDIVPVSETLYAEAFRLYLSRPDKEWRLIDCVSFVVMQQRGPNGSTNRRRAF